MRQKKLNKIQFCKICNRKIYYKTFYYSSGICGSCASKNRERNPLTKMTKEKISQKLKGRKRPEISKNMMGEKNHRFKTGKSYCLNCDKIIPYGAKHCWDCYIELELNKGINASNYIDGSSKNKYGIGFTPKLKFEIRQRDNYQCQNCSMTEEEHLVVYGFVLDCHHIDYDKNNHSKENLITLCKPCNIRANYNRKYWQGYFENKLLVSKENKGE